MLKVGLILAASYTVGQFNLQQCIILYKIIMNLLCCCPAGTIHLWKVSMSSEKQLFSLKLCDDAFCSWSERVLNSLFSLRSMGHLPTHKGKLNPLLDIFTLKITNFGNALCTLQGYEKSKAVRQHLPQRSSRVRMETFNSYLSNCT